MNQRSSFSRTKEPRREKIIRTRRDEDERSHGDEPPTRRSSAERSNLSHASSYSRFKETYIDKPRSSSKESQGSIVFRRQERGKPQSNFTKGSSGEVSPGRIPHSDTMRSEISGRLNYGSYYNRNVNSRDRDYVSKRSGQFDNSHVIDDSRLKSCLHRLLRDEDRERQASLIRQLRIIFEHPDNYKVIQNNKEDIVSTFEDFIQLGLNHELKQEFISAVGMLGAVLGVKAKSLLDWEFTVISMSKSEDIKILILKTVLEMLKTDSEKKSLGEHVPFVMSRLQSALEIADVPDLLVAIVNVIFEIATVYPTVFSKHFSDTVDILIGWHIDATQQSSVIEFTSSTLIGFQQFWISDINFTLTLLGQFLEDMESYAEGLPKSKPQPKKSVMYLKVKETKKQ